MYFLSNDGTFSCTIFAEMGYNVYFWRKINNISANNEK